MVKIAEIYNTDSKKFSNVPKVEIKILDIGNRIAPAKLTVDERIDYMHLYKTDNSQWRTINILWRYYDSSKHLSKK